MTQTTQPTHEQLDNPDARDLLAGLRDLLTTAERADTALAKTPDNTHRWKYAPTLTMLIACLVKDIDAATDAKSETEQ